MTGVFHSRNLKNSNREAWGRGFLAGHRSAFVVAGNSRRCSELVAEALEECLFSPSVLLGASCGFNLTASAGSQADSVARCQHDCRLADFQDQGSIVRP